MSSNSIAATTVSVSSSPRTKTCATKSPATMLAAR
jgi:hypothetical protein